MGAEAVDHDQPMSKPTLPGGITRHSLAEHLDPLQQGRQRQSGARLGNGLLGGQDSGHAPQPSKGHAGQQLQNQQMDRK